MNSRKLVLTVLLGLAALVALVITIGTVKCGLDRIVTIIAAVGTIHTALAALVWFVVLGRDQDNSAKDCADEAIDNLCEALDQEALLPPPSSIPMAQLGGMMLRLAEQCQFQAMELSEEGKHEQARATAESGLRAVRLWQQYRRLVDLQEKLLLAIVSGRALALEHGSSSPVVMDWSLAAVRVGLMVLDLRQTLHGNSPACMLDVLSARLMRRLPDLLKMFDLLAWATLPRNNRRPTSENWSNYTKDLAAVHDAFATLDAIG